MATIGNALNISQNGFQSFNNLNGIFTGYTVIPPQNGGTGAANNAASILTISGAFPLTATLTASTSVTFPTSGTLATTSQLISTPVTVSNGGTGQTTLTNHGVLVGAGTSAITQLATGSAGQVLQSGGASADPAYSTATYPSTATGTGKVLVADGTNWVASTPTFPNASATSRKIIVSDGTNWVASTETWATPSTSGNVLTSDGTNWTSATAPGGGVLSKSVTLTSAQIKALHATPIQLVAAAGVGTVIQVISCISKFTYAGTNQFTNGGTISLVYKTSLASICALFGNSNMLGAASLYLITTTAVPAQAIANLENLDIQLYNPSATEFAGNAGNDNTVTVNISYKILTLA